MGVNGNLRTMALPDLLQWAKVNRKTGTFELQRNGVRRCLAFRDGVIVACTSNDASLLGQYLLTSSKVTSEKLHAALAMWRDTGKPLTKVVVEQGIVTEEELREELTTRAEETIYSLFDWMDASFTFDDHGSIDNSWTEVEIDIDSILLNGLQRLDEVKMIRSVFPNSAIILERTEIPAPEQITNSGMARRIVASIDGQASLASVLDQAQASEFLVVKFLYHLFRKGVIAVREALPAVPGAATIVDDLVLPAIVEEEIVVEESTESAAEEFVELAQIASLFDEPPSQDPVDEVEPLIASDVPASLAAAAADLMGVADMGFSTEPEIDVSFAVELKHPVAEDAPIDLALNRVPVMLREAGSMIGEHLSAEACMLVQLIGAQMDIAMILGTAPLSEAAVLDELRDLAERGIIVILAPGDVDSAVLAPVSV